jgi:hypothetical protein
MKPVKGREKRMANRAAQFNVLRDVIEEREKQDKKWGEQNHAPAVWQNILMEEVGAASKAVLDYVFGSGSVEDYRAEMVQVAAVAIAAIESFDRRKVKKAA